MRRVRAVLAYGCPMLGGAIALVAGPVVVGGLLVHPGHERVPMHLRDDRCRRHRGYLPIAGDERVQRPRHWDSQVAVAAVPVCLDSIDEPAEDLDVRPSQAARVDVIDAHLRHRPGESLDAEYRVDLLALTSGEQLAVAEEWVAKALREHHRSGDEGPRVRA